MLSFIEAGKTEGQELFKIYYPWGEKKRFITLETPTRCVSQQAVAYMSLKSMSVSGAGDAQLGIISTY